MIFYLLFIGSPVLISLFFGFIGLASVLILYGIIRRFDANWFVSLSLILLAAAMTSLYWPLRPEALAGLFVLLLVFLIQKYRISYILIPLFFLWGLLYGASAFLGILILLWFLLTQRLWTKQAFVVSSLCFVACLLNGYGFRSFFYIFLIPSIAGHTGEWLPLFQTVNPTFPDIALSYQSVVLSYLIFCLLVVPTLLVGWSRKHGKLSDLFFLSFAIAIVAPFFSTRFLSLAALCGSISLGYVLPRFSRRSLVMLGIIFFLGAGTLSLTRFLTIPVSVGIDPVIFPEKAIHFLQEHHVRGNIYSQQELGAYVSWSLPKSKIYFDTRDDLYQQIGLFQTMTAFQQGRLSASELFDRYGVTIALITSAEAPMFHDIFTSSQWRLVFLADGASVVVRKELVEQEHLHSLTSVDPSSNPPFQRSAGQAMHELNVSLQQDPSSAENRVKLIEIELYERKTRDAVKNLTQLIKQEFLIEGNALDQVEAHELAGEVYLADGDCDDSFTALQEADRLSQHRFIFSPTVRLTATVDEDLGDYYALCRNDRTQATAYYERYLNSLTSLKKKLLIIRKIDTLSQ